MMFPATLVNASEAFVACALAVLGPMQASEPASQTISGRHG